MEALRQNSFVASCTRDLHDKTFAESLILFLKSIFEQCHLELSHKKVLRMCKKHKNHETFMVYGMYI